MIESFGHRGLKKLYTRGEGKAFPSHVVPIIEDILARLDVAKDVEAMRLPGYRLHQLAGQYKGYWSVTVLGNYRVIFTFKDGIATNLDYLDYH